MNVNIGHYTSKSIDSEEWKTLLAALGRPEITDEGDRIYYEVANVAILVEVPSRLVSTIFIDEGSPIPIPDGVLHSDSKDEVLAKLGPPDEDRGWALSWERDAYRLRLEFKDGRMTKALVMG